MNKNAHRHTIAATAVLATVFALTGCSAGGSGGSGGAKAGGDKPAQSHSEACDIVKRGFEEFVSIQSELGSAMSDPSKASALMEKLDSKFQAIDAKITNADVKKATSEAAGAVDDYTEFIKKGVADPTSIDPSALQDKLKAFQSGVTSVTDECK
ncbi:hypothetical protein [Leifsonia poae]|uniref:hypothetical protein n=1 Tax=Leifsonia poae TaxID=110933 RepID=UPI001CBDDB81|nr:hypothetical protein [Leifsonia poae]